MWKNPFKLTLQAELRLSRGCFHFLPETLPAIVPSYVGFPKMGNQQIHLCSIMVEDEQIHLCSINFIGPISYKILLYDCTIMVEDGGEKGQSAEEWLLRAQELVPVAAGKAKEAKGFPGRWRMIILKLEQIPLCLSDLSSHPFFLKNELCKEQLQAASKTLSEAIELARLCVLCRGGEGVQAMAWHNKLFSTFAPEGK